MPSYNLVTRLLIDSGVTFYSEAVLKADDFECQLEHVTLEQPRFVEYCWRSSGNDLEHG